MFEWFKKKEAPEPEGVKSFGGPNVIFDWSPIFNGLKSCNSSLSGYKNKVVYSVTNALVSKLLEVPIIVSTDKSTDKAKYFRTSKSINNEKLWMSKVLGIQEVIDHPLLDLLGESPNEYQTAIAFKRAFWFNRILSGAGIIYVERSGGLSRKSGKIIAIHVLPTYLVQVIESKDWKNPIAGYMFMSPTGLEIPLNAQDVLYCGSWSPDSMYKGWNPFESAGKTVDKNNINDLAQRAAFENGGTGILFSSDTITDGVGGVSDKMSPENMASLKEMIVREYAGAKNNKRMHFTNGYVNVTSFGDTLADLKLIEASETEVKEICAVFGVSPIIIGEGKSNTESNVVQAYKSLVTNNVVPKLREFDMAFNKFSDGWFKDNPVKISHDITEFAELMPNMELIKKVYGDNAAITLNEYRVLLGMDTMNDPNFDKSYIQSGFVPLADAGFTNSYTGTQAIQNG